MNKAKLVILPSRYLFWQWVARARSAMYAKRHDKRAHILFVGPRRSATHQIIRPVHEAWHSSGVSMQ